jgi:ketosteroid isomerase-like protein
MNAAKLQYLVCVCVLLSACAPGEPPKDTEDVRQAFQDLSAAWMAGDMDAVWSFYHDDITRLPARGGIVKGLQVLREDAATSIEQSDLYFDDIGEATIQRSGDLAVTYSTYHERRVWKETGSVTRQNGLWLLVWRRQVDGSWKVSTSTWTIEAHSNSH